MLSVHRLFTKQRLPDDSLLCQLSGSLWYHTLEHWYSKCTSQMDTTESSWDWLEMQNLKLHPRWISGAEMHESLGLGFIDLF